MNKALLLMTGLLALSLAVIIALIGLVVSNSGPSRSAAPRGADSAAGVGERGAAGARPPQRGGNSTVVVFDDPFLGPLLTDAAGMTLYRLEPDIDSGVRDCLETNGCAAEWPPLIVTGALTRPTALPGQLTTRRRADGREQVVYNGWPLYRSKEDVDPGDSFGYLFSDQWGDWFVVEPDEPPPLATPTPVRR